MSAPLIDVPELAGLLTGGRPPTLLDVRWSLTGPPGRTAFATGHLPGAQFVDLDAELAGPPGRRGRHPLPDRGAFVAAMRSHGVGNGRAVVVYDQRDGTSAARAWWLLRHYGHPVRVLDGGFDAWAAAGQTVKTGEGTPVRPGDFDGVPGSLPVLDTDDVLGFAAEHALLDARAGERYSGEVEPVDPVAGHIPGAISAPTAENLRTDGTWSSAGRLRERFEALVGTAGRVGVYCGSGVTAAHEVLALEVAGFEAALYPGSWSEWVAEPAGATASGPRPVSCSCRRT